MLAKLRRQFILIIMTLVTAALAIMAGVIIYINHQQLSNDVMSAVDYATTENAFEGRGMPPGGGAKPGWVADESSRVQRIVEPQMGSQVVGQMGDIRNAPLDAGDLDDDDDYDFDDDDDYDDADDADDDDAEDGYGSGYGYGAGDADDWDDADDWGDIDDLDDDLDDLDDWGERQDEGRARGANMVATSVYLIANGTVSRTLVDSLELDDDSLGTAVTEVTAHYESAQVQTGSVTGHLDDLGLYYSIRKTPAGMKAAFASDAYVANSIWNLELVLGVVSLCVWVAFLLVSIVLARWVVRPTERAWNQQQQFVADASHELKTPLAVMMANNSILLSHADDTVGNQRRWVESNQVEARQMLQLVNDMLFLARPENAAERQRVLQDVDLSALVQGNVLQFEAVCFERGIELSDNIAPGLQIRGDEKRLQRLVSTLIDNACKYADSRVEVGLRREGGKVQLAITNDGAVIPPEDLPHVFDRFYRVDKARVRSEGGVGLGLAIAHEVAREHGGEIAVASSEQAGTTFTATLPV